MSQARNKISLRKAFRPCLPFRLYALYSDIFSITFLASSKKSTGHFSTNTHSSTASPPVYPQTHNPNTTTQNAYPPHEHNKRHQQVLAAQIPPHRAAPPQTPSRRPQPRPPRQTQPNASRHRPHRARSHRRTRPKLPLHHALSLPAHRVPTRQPRVLLLAAHARRANLRVPADHGVGRAVPGHRCLATGRLQAYRSGAAESQDAYVCAVCRDEGCGDPGLGV